MKRYDAIRVYIAENTVNVIVRNVCSVTAERLVSTSSTYGNPEHFLYTYVPAGAYKNGDIYRGPNPVKMKQAPAATVHGANSDINLYDRNSKGVMLAIAHRDGTIKADSHLCPEAAATLAEKLITWLVITGNCESMKKVGGFMTVFGEGMQELSEEIGKLKQSMTQEIDKHKP